MTPSKIKSTILVLENGHGMAKFLVILKLLLKLFQPYQIQIKKINFGTSCATRVSSFPRPVNYIQAPS